jgi:ankyrin repeat protein
MNCYSSPCSDVSVLRLLQVMSLLLDAGANPNSTDNNGCSCIWIASKRGDAEAVQLLITRGANVCLANKEGTTPGMRHSV